MASNYRTNSEEEEEEALFRSYPYPVYFVQSPSTISHANNSEMTFHSPAAIPTTHLSLSRYSSSRGSNNSFSQDEKKPKLSDEKSHGVNGDKMVISSGEEINVKNGVNYEEINEDYDDYDDEYKGFLKYFYFDYSNSMCWILVQLSWRFLLSLMIALAVFYFAAKPPAPRISIKMAGIRQFKLGEGVDSTGVTTKILSCNCSIDLIIDNKSKLFGLHIHPPTMQIFFDHLPFAISKGGELYAGNDDLTMFKLNVGIKNKAMYGAGRSMEDLLESGKGLPLVIKLKFKSNFHIVWALIQSKFHHQAQCFLLLDDNYDKKHRTQVYNSKCIIIP